MSVLLRALAQTSCLCKIPLGFLRRSQHLTFLWLQRDPHTPLRVTSASLEA